MKIAYFTRYTRKGASSRLRSYQYFPWLWKKGIEADVFPLFTDEYLSQLYQKKKGLGKYVIAAYCRRVLQLVKLYRYDLVVIEKELFPYLPAWAERLLRLFGVKYVADYDDAIHHNYDLHSNYWVRLLLGNKIPSVMRHAAAVTVGNSYLYDKAIASGAKRVEIIPTVVDFLRYQERNHDELNAVLKIGWIGSPSTAHYLWAIVPVLERLAMQYPVELVAVGVDKAPESEVLPIKLLPWSEDTEAGHVSSFDIGVMPLEDTPWANGKCAYKIIQYMACSVPAVASPVGMNRDVIKHGFSGYHANTPEEWYKWLEFLIVKPRARSLIGQIGRAEAEGKYSVEVTRQKLITLFKEIVHG